MKRRITSLMLALLMLLSILPAAFAAISFDDVLESDWFYDDVMWAVGNGMVKGKTETTFAPQDPIKRGEMVTLLYRYEREPAVSGSMPFTDVPESKFYYNPILWASQQGFVNGRTATTFEPETSIKRGEMVTILWRYEGEPAVSGSHPFVDVLSDKFYNDPIIWAVQNRIVNGKDDTHFDPEATATRAEMVAVLHRYFTLKIITHPEDVIAEVGMPATFTVAAHGGKAPYQYWWRVLETDGTGSLLIDNEYASVTGPTLTLKRVTAAEHNTRYYCTVIDGDGQEVSSNEATLTVVSSGPLQIKTQPQTTTVETGSDAAFIVTPIGGTPPYTYQWATSEGPLEEGEAYEGTQTAFLTVKAPGIDDDGKQFFCTVTDAGDASVTSSTATLHVVDVDTLRITSQPSDVTEPQGMPAVFSVSVSGGTEPYSYQWGFRSGFFQGFLMEGPSYQGTGTADLTVKSTSLSDSGDKYYCIVTDANGDTVTSHSAVLTVSDLQITTQPVDITVETGEDAAFTVAVSGGTAPYFYQWYTLDGHLTEGDSYQGTTAASLTVKSPASDDDGTQFYCTVRDANGVWLSSDTATLQVVAPGTLRISSQPSDVTVPMGTNATFTVAAAGGKAPYSYQWRTPTGFLLESVLYQGTGTDTLTIKSPGLAQNGNKYFCTVTDADGNKVDSNTVTLKVTGGILLPLQIKTQPQDVTVPMGTNATFTVAAVGGKAPYSYQWRTPSGFLMESTLCQGTGTDTLTVKSPNLAQNGNKYFCTVTDADGDKVDSNTVTLKVTGGILLPLQIKTQPQEVAVVEGKQVTFTVEAVGGKTPYSYEWHCLWSSGTDTYCINASLYDGIGTPSLTVKQCKTSSNGDKFYCVIKDADGKTITSDKATLIVNSAGLTVNPQPQDVTVVEGKQATFTVAVSGGKAPYSYEWHCLWPSGTDAHCNNTSIYSGYKEPTLTVLECKTSQNGYKFYCIVKDADGKRITSNKATLTVNPKILQP